MWGGRGRLLGMLPGKPHATAEKGGGGKRGGVGGGWRKGGGGRRKGGYRVSVKRG